MTVMKLYLLTKDYVSLDSYDKRMYLLYYHLIGLATTKGNDNKCLIESIPRRGLARTRKIAASAVTL